MTIAYISAYTSTGHLRRLVPRLHTGWEMRRFVDENPSDVCFSRHMEIPDELFFQTIRPNSAEAERCVDFRLHYTEWSRRPVPAILTGEDYPQLIESSYLSTCRFDPAADREILDLNDDGPLR